MKSNPTIWAIGSLIALALASGCDQQKSGPVATSPEANTNAAALEQTPSPAGTELFATVGHGAAIPIGTAADVEFGITPSDGFKINKEYPWSFEFHPHDAVQFTSSSIAMESLKLDDARATIPAKITASKPGEHTLTATGNFSVCNDDKCELYRNREVTFKMAATDG